MQTSSWPCDARHTAAQQTSRRTGAPCRPTQNTTSATWNPSSRHWVSIGEEGRKKHTNAQHSNCPSFVSIRYIFQNSQKSMQHAGERRDSYSTRNTNTDIVVKHFLWWTSKWTIHVKPEHTMWTKTQEIIKQETGQTYTHIFILSPQGQTHTSR